MQKIIEATDNKNIVGKSLDLASFESVRNFAKDINNTEDRLDILINNAGVYTNDNLTLRVNHVSVFLLTHLLLGEWIFKLTHYPWSLELSKLNYWWYLIFDNIADKLKSSAPSRIINVGSYAGRYVYLHPGNVDCLRKEPTFDFLGYFFVPAAYRISKLCNILFTIELARRLQGTAVTVNTLHPGTVGTGLFRETKGFNQLLKMQIARLLVWVNSWVF